MGKLVWFLCQAWCFLAANQPGNLQSEKGCYDALAREPRATPHRSGDMKIRWHLWYVVSTQSVYTCKDNRTYVDLYDIFIIYCTHARAYTMIYNTCIHKTSKFTYIICIYIYSIYYIHIQYIHRHRTCQEKLCAHNICHLLYVFYIHSNHLKSKHDVTLRFTLHYTTLNFRTSPHTRQHPT